MHSNANELKRQLLNVTAVESSLIPPISVVSIKPEYVTTRSQHQVFNVYTV